MRGFRRLTWPLFLRSAGYFLVLSLSVSYLFLPGLNAAWDTRNVLTGAMFILLSVLICYMVTALYLTAAPKDIFTGVSGRSFSDVLRSLPKLVAVLAIFAAAFSVISGLLSLLIYYVILSGFADGDRRGPIIICTMAVVILSAPFFWEAFALFSGGETGFRKIISSGIRMGAAAYGKYLLLGLVTFCLAFLFRILTESLPALPGQIISLLLTSAVFGAAIPLSWIIHAGSIEGKGETK